MQEKTNNKTFDGEIEEFLRFRKGLSEVETKMEAGLLVEEIKAVNAGEAFRKVQNRIKRNFRAHRTLTTVTRFAAVFSLPLLAFTIWSLFLRENFAEQGENQITWQEIQSPAGMRSHVILPDGTDLWLNAGSKISYGIPFIRETRQIGLTGEAYFQVVKNEKAPFVVNAGAATVKVLGTYFNVKAYPDEKQTEIALEEGSVELQSATAGGENNVVRLVPNDYLVLDKQTGEVTVENKNIDKYILWRRDIMIFDDTPMPEVAKILERWYGIKVVVGDAEINKYRFTTTFENESLFHVLELLELSSPSVSIKYTPGKINKKSNIASPSTVIITKK